MDTNLFQPYLERDGNRFELARPKITIGRSVQNNIVLEDLEASRIHCYLEHINGNWFISDNSLNGTLINKSMRIHNMTRYQLQNGDVINIGSNVDFKFIDKPPISSLVMTEEQQEENSVILIENCNNSNVTVSKLLNQPSVQQADTVAHKSHATPAVVVTGTIDEELICSICMELFIDATTLNCEHTFCEFCITEWRRTRRNCPLCRQKITQQLRTTVIDNVIVKVLQSADEDVKSARSRVIEERRTVKPPMKVNNDPIESISIDDDDDDEGDQDTEDDDDSHLDDDSDYRDDDSVMLVFNYNDYVDEQADLLITDETTGDDWIPYNGVPGRYYGGYGRCYRCSERGHWANGCPNRNRIG